MKISIRSKLVIAISILMIGVFSAAAYLFISEKKVELADDIYYNSLAFSRLSAREITNFYDLYLAEGSFVYFNREMATFFEQNDDIEEISVISFAGNILYDSATERDKQYQGVQREVSDSSLNKQIQSENISVKTLDGRIVYIKDKGGGNYVFVDSNEKEVEPLEQGVLIKHIVVPASEKYSVIYTITYENLDERIATMMRRMIYLAIFAIMLGMMLSFGMAAQFVKPVKKLVFGVGEIAKGNFKSRVAIKTHDEMKYLGDAFNQMAVDLEKSVEAKLYKERVTRELEIAGDIQKQIIPKDIPRLPGMDISADIIPAEEIGGDMYDFIPLGNNKLMMYLGDVTGHGVPAGIVSSISNALFYAYSAEPDLKNLITAVNKVLTAKTMPSMFMTLCLMEWDGTAKKFTYVNAGHEQIIHYKAKEQKAVLTESKGIALGMIPDIADKVSLVEIPLEVGDSLLVYSDGIPEAWRSKTEAYGMDKLVNTMGAAGKFADSSQMKDYILKDVKTFTGDYKQMDDITLIVIKRTA